MKHENLKWVTENEVLLLRNDSETLIELKIKTGDDSSFTIQNKKYLINKKGFWNPVYVIKNNEVELFRLSHNFWGSNGRIVQRDGSIYKVRYSFRRGFKISFMKSDNEIFNYCAFLEKNKRVFSFSVGSTIIDADLLLILAALGMKIIYSMYVGEEANGDVDTFMMLTASGT